ncbi:MAG: ATP-binding protein [bacterium]|nr:ATP-binding protein [bacterium]
MKKQIYANKKTYFIDPCMAQQIGFRFSQDIGRMLENIIFLELKRRNKELFFHKDQKECDFLIRKGNKIIEAIQVTHNLKGNKEREIQGLVEALDTHKLKTGIIITMDEEGKIEEGEKSINLIPIWKWLLIRD